MKEVIQLNLAAEKSKEELNETKVDGSRTKKV